MLNKLLKYEFQATGRMFMPAYGVLLILAVLQRIMMEFNIYSSNNISINILSLIVPGIFIAAIVAVFVITLVAMVNRFYKNLLGREGYLMFTLPVSVAQLMWSKIIVATIWSILSLIAALISLLIVFSEPQYINQFFSELGILISKAHGVMAGNLIIYCIESIILVICSIASFIFMIYLCLSIGQLVNKHRGLCAFGAFIGINIVLNNIIASIITGLCSNMDFSGLSSLFESMSSYGQMHLALIGSIIVMVIQSAVYFLVTRYILSNKLNLE